LTASSKTPATLKHILMPRISTATRKRLDRSRRRRQREIGVREPVRGGFPFRFDASLLIAGVGAQHDTISRETGLFPSHAHTAGEWRSTRSATLGVWPEDLWILASPLGELASLDEHLDWLWSAIAPHKPYFDRLIADAAWAKVSLGCFSESIYPVLNVDTKSMKIMREMNLGLSFNITCV
jgi:hypothetical protein